MDTSSKLTELNDIILTTLLARIKGGEKVTASLLAQAIAYLKLHDMSKVAPKEVVERDNNEDMEEIREFLQNYPLSGRKEF